MEIRNARISNISITMAEHGCLTFWVYLEGGGWGCGFGGYCIGLGFLGADPDQFTSESGNGLVAMMRIMNVVGVDKWENLKGQYVRCKLEGVASAKHVVEIGNILTNKWFNIEEFFTERNVKNEHD